MPLQGKVMRIALGGFLEPIEHFERRGTVIFVTEGVEHDKRNPPLHLKQYVIYRSDDLRAGNMFY
jgi:hypothetical protein